MDGQVAYLGAGVCPVFLGARALFQLDVITGIDESC